MYASGQRERELFLMRFISKTGDSDLFVALWTAGADIHKAIFS